jgi:4-hydroxyphenylpyruvate dioxygenase
MRKSIATVSLGGTLTEKLEAIAHADFDEISEPDLLSYEGTAREIAGTPRISV